MALQSVIFYDSLSRFLRVPKEEVEGMVKNIAHIALEIFKISLATWVNPYFTFAAFGMGLLFPEASKSKLDRIVRVYEYHKFYAIPIMIGMAVVYLPMVLLSFSLYTGARLGSQIMHLDVGSSDDGHQMLAVSGND